MLKRPIAIALAVLGVVVMPAFAQIRSEIVVGGLTQPVAFVQNPADPTMQVIVQQNGRIRVLKNGALQAADFLNISSIVLNSGEQGLLGLAFAPDYATSGRVFINFVNQDSNTVIARFVRMASDPLRLEPASRFDLMWPSGQRFISQPFTNHKGGNLTFGPDGFLYIGMGDGGSGNDPFHHAQNPQQLLGKMLRIDVSVPDSDPEGYDVPASNPFVGQAGVMGEIWSFGLRNPWRFSFDNPQFGGTGALVLGDVGQGAFEEIDYEPAGRGGRNYGWRNREGAHNNVTNLPPFSVPLTDPIFEYPRSSGQSVTGGFVYRGAELGFTYRGRYFFADFVASRVWSIRLSVGLNGEATASDLIEHTAELGSVGNPSTFGEDASGELYVVSYAGAVYRIRALNVVAPIPGRPRPPGATIVGTAVPRNQTAGSAPTPTSATAKAAAVSTAAALIRTSPELAVAILIGTTGSTGHDGYNGSERCTESEGHNAECDCQRRAEVLSDLMLRALMLRATLNPRDRS
jgi:glucose/arabinose dehydrogenase